jgi:hypothetical protein
VKFHGITFPIKVPTQLAQGLTKKEATEAADELNAVTGTEVQVIEEPSKDGNLVLMDLLAKMFTIFSSMLMEADNAVGMRV